MIEIARIKRREVFMLFFLPLFLYAPESRYFYKTSLDLNIARIGIATEVTIQRT